MPVSGSVFRILVVCTGNISRSPAVERLLRHTLDDRSVEITSAGVHALVGEPMDPRMAELVVEAGADPSGFFSRQAEAELVRHADLVLALTREHRSYVVGLVPAAVRRTFTLGEFARLVQAVDVSELDPQDDAGAKLAAIMPLAASARMTAPGEDDINDPFGRSDDTYRRVFAMIRQATAAIVSVA